MPEAFNSYWRVITDQRNVFVIVQRHGPFEIISLPWRVDGALRITQILDHSVESTLSTFGHILKMHKPAWVPALKVSSLESGAGVYTRKTNGFYSNDWFDFIGSSFDELSSKSRIRDWFRIVYHMKVCLDLGSIMSQVFRMCSVSSGRLSWDYYFSPIPLLKVGYSQSIEYWAYHIKIILYHTIVWVVT